MFYNHIVTEELYIFIGVCAIFLVFRFLAGLYYVKLSKWEVRLRAEFVLKWMTPRTLSLDSLNVRKHNINK